MFHHKSWRRYLLLTFSSLLVFPFCSQLASADPGADLLRKVQEKFQTLQSLSVHFEMRAQAADSSLISDLTSTSGRLFLGEQGKFRMESGGQVIVCDGLTIWLFHPAERQVIIYPALENQSPFLTPRQLLFDYAKNYHLEKVADEPLGKYSCRILEMKPLDPSDPTRLVKVWVDRREYLTRRFLIEDLIGNVIIFDFEEFHLGQNLPDSTFQFVPPPGVEVVDLR